MGWVWIQVPLFPIYWDLFENLIVYTSFTNIHCISTNHQGSPGFSVKWISGLKRSFPETLESLRDFLGCGIRAASHVQSFLSPGDGLKCFHTCLGTNLSIWAPFRHIRGYRCLINWVHMTRESGAHSVKIRKSHRVCWKSLFNLFKPLQKKNKLLLCNASAARGLKQEEFCDTPPWECWPGDWKGTWYPVLPLKGKVTWFLFVITWHYKWAVLFSEHDFKATELSDTERLDKIGVLLAPALFPSNKTAYNCIWF